MNDNLTTLLCLFHHEAQAHAATRDLAEAGVPQSSVSMIDGAGATSGEHAALALQGLGVPERDQRHLVEGIREGGLIVVVNATDAHVGKVESIFGKHQATKIDEAVLASHVPEVVPPAPAASTAIPVIEEELVVGKREVDRGGVRVYRRVVEIPVEESVNLREEHVHVDRHAVDRAATQQDIAMQGDRMIELTETAEQVIVGKSAQVVEEVHVGKQVSERTEHIHDTVRQTEVEVQEIVPEVAAESTPGYDHNLARRDV